MKILLIVAVCVLIYGVLFYFMVVKKPKKQTENKYETLESLKDKANKDVTIGKGGVNDWSDNQKEYVLNLIGSDLLRMQDQFGVKKMDIKDFISNINNCLMCIVKNFSEKYSYADILDKMGSEGKYEDFDQWFKNLYSTCDCNDKLGRMLVKLMREFWIDKSVLECPATKNEITKCISDIAAGGELSDYFYTNMVDCINRYCPQILK